MQCTVQTFVVTFQIMSTGTFFSQSDTVGSGILNNIILDNPPLTPMGSNHPHLFGCRSSPLRGGLAYMETTNRDIIQSLTCRIETSRTNRYFYCFLIRINISKICINRCIIRIYFCEPYIRTPLGITYCTECIRCKHLIQAKFFIKRNIIQIYISRMMNPFRP